MLALVAGAIGAAGPAAGEEARLRLDQMVERVAEAEPAVPRERAKAWVRTAKILRQYANGPHEEEAATLRILAGDTVEPLPGSIVRCGLGNAFDHTGIYVGGGRIIHRDGRGYLMEATVEEFLDRIGGRNNATVVSVLCDERGRPLADPSAAEAARRAHASAKERDGYDFIGRNCHHFCRLCWGGGEESATAGSSLERFLERTRLATYGHLIDYIESSRQVKTQLVPWRSSLVDLIREESHDR